MRFLFLSLLSLVVPAIASPQELSAAKRYESLIHSLQSARRAKDYPAYRSAAQLFRELLNSSPESLVPVARASALSGNLTAALDALRQYAAMGQSSDEFFTSPEFAALRADPGFAPLAAPIKLHAL